MKFRFFIFLFFVLGFPVFGQAQSCIPPRESITTLRKPPYGTPPVWDAVYKDKDAEIMLFSGTALSRKNMIVTGVRLPYETSTDRLPSAFITDFNHRGRTLDKARFKIVAEDRAVKIIPYGSGYLLGLNKSDGTVALSWHDKDGRKTKEKILKDKRKAYELHDLIPAMDNTDILAVLHARPDQGQGHGIVMRFQKSGKKRWERAYRPGLSGEIKGLFSLKDGSFLATGQSNDGKQTAGWVAQLDKNGTLSWQYIFPRGTRSALKASIETKNGFILLGHSSPANAEPQAAWIVALDKAGAVVWERFIRDESYGFSAVDLLSHPDGRMTAFLNATPGGQANERARPHIRLLTLSARGDILHDAPYVEGQKTQAYETIAGPDNTRLVIATTEGPKGREGWVLLAEAPGPWDDPCIQ